ncbi:hypothetical protein FDB24_02100 [Clostridium botulinum]|uniref:ABC-three component system middle component 2 n=1 Tax=Clostridium botulinum TaxID=1491 RepID=UPI000773E787|nr:ABC-three component system middle component 2 [Clostridium botulinum]NFL85838.1 hypothetical protein [Clostridium botulinum]NFO20087.1 hypothetical protein [Clostridium botulinum]
MMKTKIKIFNSPEEVGVRILFILDVYQRKMSSQRIMYYDYFSLHLNDIDNTYESLHPDNPNHSSEIAVRRDLIKKALNLMIEKGLISIKYLKTGIYYQKNQLTTSFVDLFENGYAIQLKKNIKVVDEKFLNYSDKQIYEYINKNIGSWVGEFEKNIYTGSDVHE